MATFRKVLSISYNNLRIICIGIKKKSFRLSITEKIQGNLKKKRLCVDYILIPSAYIVRKKVANKKMNRALNNT